MSISAVQGFTYDYTSDTELTRIVFNELSKRPGVKVYHDSLQNIVVDTPHSTTMFRGIEHAASILREGGVFGNKPTMPWRPNRPTLGRIMWNVMNEMFGV